jgi:hypothetical protein
MNDGSAANSPEGDDRSEAPDDDEEWTPLAGLSDEGLLLLFAGSACLFAATTATTRGQPEPIAVSGAAAAVVALVIFTADLLSAYVPGSRVHLLVGGAALVGTGGAVLGRHYINAATLGVAAALVLWRVFDVEVLGAE